MVSTRRPDVDWDGYAAGYDLMADNNPAYQELRSLLREEMTGWEVPPGGLIADLGGGTGNFSIDVAARFPQATVFHVDSSGEMNRWAADKAARRGCQNFTVRTEAVEGCAFPDGTLAAIICVHALYTLPEPGHALSRFGRWLRPGGYLFACDLGRRMDVADWRSYLFWQSRRRLGLLKTLRLFWRARVVAGSNRAIRSLQESGRYWLHTGLEFQEAVRASGLTITRSQPCYRGYSDLVVAVKH